MHHSLNLLRMNKSQRVLHVLELVTQRVFLVLRLLILSHHFLWNFLTAIQRLGKNLSVRFRHAPLWRHVNVSRRERRFFGTHQTY